MKLFRSNKEWRKYITSSIGEVLIGILKILWSLAGGLVSYAVYVFSSIRAYAKREFKAALITAFIILLAFVCGIFTFVNERSMRMRAEFQRDSIYLTLDSVKQMTYTLESNTDSYFEIIE